MMATITVIDSEGKVDFNFPLADKPVRLGKGENCNKVLPELPANGPQLEIEYEASQNRLLARRLSSGCEVWIGDQRIGDGSAIWPAEIELRIGTYRLTNDLGAANGPISAQDGFSVVINSGEDYLSLTPGAPMNCSLRITNQSARNVTGALHVEINGQPIKWCAGAGNMGRTFTPYEERTFTLTFTAPTNSTVRAGTYQVDITAIPDSRVEKFRSGGDSLTAIVERFAQHSQRTDRLLRFNPLLGFIFRSARFNLEVNNTGNCDDTYFLAATPNTDSDERTEYQFTDTGAPKTSLEVAVGKANAAQLQVQRPLLWFPLWKGHRFNASIADGANQIVRFTQLSVIWLVLIIAGLGGLGWLGMKILMGPYFAQSPIASLSKLDVNREGGNPDDPIKAGEPVTVIWDAPNASVVDIYQVGDNGVLKPIVKDHNAAEQKFPITKGFDKAVKLRVVAKNSFGQNEREIDVPVLSEEAEVIFDPPTGRKVLLTDDAPLGPCTGGSMNFGWEVKGRAIRNVMFDGETVALKGSACKPVFPPTVTYELKVNYTNGQEPTVKKYVVIVATPTPTPSPSPTPSPTPPICDPSNTFNVAWPEGSDKGKKRAAAAIKRGDQVVLNWDVKNVDSIKITKDEGNGTSPLQTSSQMKGSTETITPQRRTTYTFIIVKSGQEVVCKTISVAVKCKYPRKLPPFYEWRDCQ